jgi:hypothetical protein
MFMGLLHLCCFMRVGRKRRQMLTVVHVSECVVLMEWDSKMKFEKYWANTRFDSVYLEFVRL